jgi:hypothetical protein
MPRRDSLLFVALPVVLLGIGCSKRADAGRDTAAAPAAIGGANANPVDTGMTSSTRDSAGTGHDTSHAAHGDSTRRAP